MSEVTRFSVGNFSGTGTAHAQGCWVRYRDFSQLESDFNNRVNRVAKLAHERNKLRACLDRVTTERDALRAPLAEACEMLKEIRQDGYHSHKRDSQIDSFLSATSTPEPDHE